MLRTRPSVRGSRRDELLLLLLLVVILGARARIFHMFPRMTRVPLFPHEKRQVELDGRGRGDSQSSYLLSIFITCFYLSLS